MRSMTYKTRQGLHMALLSGIFWFAWAMTNYWSVYLKEQGFDASMVGVLNSFCSATSIASIPLWGIIADKTRSVKKVEVFLCIMTGLLWGIVPLYPRIFGKALWPFFLGVPLACFFKNPTNTFHENLIVRNCNELGLEYGKLRWVGSLLFIFGSVVIFLVAPNVGYDSTWWMFGIFLIPTALMTLFTRDPKGTETEGEVRKKKEKLDLKQLLKNRPYLIFLGFTLIYYLALCFESIFIPFFMEEIHVDASNYTIFVAYRAAMEIPLLLGMKYLKKYLNLKRLLQIVPLLQVIECVFFCFFVSTWGGMLFAATFMGLGNGIFIGAVYNYVYDISPDNLKASAQGFFATISSIGSILGSFLGGFVMDWVGGRKFYLVTAALFILSALFLIASDMGRKKQELQEE